MPLDIEVYIDSDNNRFMAACHELALYSEGKTPEEAVEKLQKIIIRYLSQKNNIALDFDIEQLSIHYYSKRMVQIH